MAHVKMLAHRTMIVVATVVVTAATLGVAHEAAGAAYSVGSMVIHR